MNSQASLNEQLTLLAALMEDDDRPEVAAWLRNVVRVVHAARGAIALPENARVCIKLANAYGLYDAADWVTNRLAGESK